MDNVGNSHWPGIPQHAPDGTPMGTILTAATLPINPPKGIYPSPMVTSLDEAGILKACSYKDGVPLSAPHADWADISLNNHSSLRLDKPILSNDDTGVNGWTGAIENHKDHISYGAFMPFCSGWSMGDLMKKIGKIPNRSYMKTSITFKLSDLVSKCCVRLRIRGIWQHG